MTVFIMLGKSDALLTVPLPAEGLPAGSRPKARFLIREGDSFHGHTYEEIRALGSGRREIEPKGASQPTE